MHFMTQGAVFPAVSWMTLSSVFYEHWLPYPASERILLAFFLLSSHSKWQYVMDTLKEV